MDKSDRFTPCACAWDYTFTSSCDDLYLNEYLPLWSWRTCTRIKVVILHVQLSVTMLAVTYLHAVCILKMERYGIQFFSDLECMGLLKWFVQNADHHCLSCSLTGS